MIQLLIAGDRRLLRQGLRHLLAAFDDLSVVAEASNYGEAMAAIRTSRIDLAIIDLTTPGRDAVEIFEHMKEIRPAMKTLVLSMRSEPSMGVRTMSAYRDGVMPKESGIQELVAAIRFLAIGDRDGEAKSDRRGERPRERDRDLEPASPVPMESSHEILRAL